MSVPPVERVEWFYRDLPVFSGIYGEGMHYSVIENRTQDGVVSTLIIAKVSTQDFGDYTCRVSNSLGSDVASIKLSKERESHLLIFLIRIYISLFFLVICPSTLSKCYPSPILVTIFSFFLSFFVSAFVFVLVDFYSYPSKAENKYQLDVKYFSFYKI
jgi:hypothetical protein